MQPKQESVTQLLEAMRGGDHDALNALFPLVYDELRALAHRKLEREARRHLARRLDRLRRLHYDHRRKRQTRPPARPFSPPASSLFQRVIAFIKKLLGIG